MNTATTQSAKKSVYTIGEAAHILGVSIDTLRRWEASNKILAERSTGGIRLFSATEIDRLKPEAKKLQDLLSVSQAATFLGISPATLRRWDRQGVLQPQRTLGNERVYTKDSLDAFIVRSGHDQTKITNPVNRLKETAEVISDTIVITLLDRSIFQRYQRSISLGIVTALALLTMGMYSVKVRHNQDVQMTASPQFSAQNVTQTSVALPQNDDHYIMVTSPGKQVLLNIDEAEDPVPMSDPNVFQYSGSLSQKSDNTFSVSKDIKPLDISPTHDSSLLKAGSNQIVSGTSKIFIVAPTLTTSSKVFITQTSLTNGQVIAVTEKVAGKGFTVELTGPTSKSVTFDWLIISQ